MMETDSDKALSPSALLPFYANGTLEKEERSRVEAALQNDPALQEELEVLRELRETMQAETVEDTPGELMLARLKRDISREQNASPKRFDFRPLGAFAAGLAVAGFLAVAVVPQVAAVLQWGAQGPSYATASGGVGHKLVVELKDDVPVHELTSLLQDLQLTVISGPSARGLYHMQGRDNAATKEALERLQAHRDIFTYLQLDTPE